MVSISPSQELNDDELRKLFGLMIDQVLKMRPDLHMSGDRKTQIVEALLQSFNGKDAPLTRGEIYDPLFLKKLTYAIMATLACDKKEDLLSDQLINKLRLVFKSKGLDLEELKKLSPEEFKRLMKEKFTQEELKQLHQELQNFIFQLQSQVNLLFNFPKPEYSDGKVLADQAYQAFYGLLCLTPGAERMPEPVLFVNGFMFPDLNPNNGRAALDRTNDPFDNQFGGDYYGGNDAAIDRLLQFTGALVDESQDIIRQHGLAPGLQPPSLRA